MDTRTYAQTKKAPSFSVLPARKPAPRQKSLAPDVGEGHAGHNFGKLPLFSADSREAEFAGSCPLTLPSPTYCPFGGACHSCPAPVQTKLTIGKPGDRYEQEADSMADTVMSMPEPVAQRDCADCDDKDKVQRLEDDEKEEDEMVSKEEADEEKDDEELTNTAQAKELRRVPAEEDEEEETLKTKSQSGGTPQVTPQLQNSINSMKGGGQPLPESTRAFFEPRFKRDFSNVRLHTDSRAAETAKSINAQAFTVGRDIAFGAGQYSPNTSSGKRLLAHELTHTVQQRKDGELTIGRQSSQIKKVYLWTIYKKYDKDHTRIPPSDIKATKEYKDYVKFWKMDEKTAMYACILVFHKFKNGIFGREANFIASGREVLRATKKGIRKRKKNKKNGSPILEPLSLSMSLIPGMMKLEEIENGISLIRDWLLFNSNHVKYNILVESLRRLESELNRKICGPNVTAWLVAQMIVNGYSIDVKKIRALNESAVRLLIISPLISAIQKGRAYNMWHDLVGYKAPWDFKTVLGKNLTNKFLLDCRSPACTGKIYSVTLSKRCMTFEAPANIHYGYVGRLAGFSKFEMVYGAAAAGWMKLIAEHPRDKQAIIRGYDLKVATSLSAAGLNLNYYENLDSGEGSKCDPCDKIFKG